jgi:hypothetical protein
MCQNGAKNPCRSLLDHVLGYWGSLDKNYTEKMVKKCQNSEKDPCELTAGLDLVLWG